MSASASASKPGGSLRQSRRQSSMAWRSDDWEDRDGWGGMFRRSHRRSRNCAAEQAPCVRPVDDTNSEAKKRSLSQGAKTNCKERVEQAQRFHLVRQPSVHVVLDPLFSKSSPFISINQRGPGDQEIGRGQRARRRGVAARIPHPRSPSRSRNCRYPPHADRSRGHSRSTGPGPNNGSNWSGTTSGDRALCGSVDRRSAYRV